MALETATFLNGLVASNPVSGDAVRQGDDHLRLIKSTLKNTFPNLTGAMNATQAELNHVVGVTSGIQAQLNALVTKDSDQDAAINTKQATITGAATSITSANLTATRALVSDASGKVAVSPVTSAELGFIDGVTSNVQTQLNAKAPLASPALTGTPTAPTAAAGTNTTQIATTAQVQAAIDAKAIGIGQTWQNVLASRAVNTVYQNATGRPIQIMIQTDPNASTDFDISTDNSTWVEMVPGTGRSGDTTILTLTIPDGLYYRIGSADDLISWWELR